MVKKQVIVDVEQDGTLGEVRGEYKPRISKHSKKHDYYLTIADNLAETNIMLTPISQAILLQMDSNNRIVLTQELIAKLAERYKKPLGTFKSTINRMVEERSLLRESLGHYFANPYYFTKTNFEKLNNLRAEWGQIREKQFQAEVMKTKAVEKNIMKQTREILNNEGN